MRQTRANRFVVERDPSGATVRLDFDYLDTDEGAVVELLHAATSSAALGVSGTLKGAGQPKCVWGLKQQRIWELGPPEAPQAAVAPQKPAAKVTWLALVVVLFGVVLGTGVLVRTGSGTWEVASYLSWAAWGAWVYKNVYLSRTRAPVVPQSLADGFGEPL